MAEFFETFEPSNLQILIHLMLRTAVAHINLMQKVSTQQCSL